MRARTVAAALALVAGVVGIAWADDATVPSQPADPAAAKVYGVFDQACASCHQSGRLKGLRQPAGSLGDILDLAALARNPALIQPGMPDASPLYNAIQSRAMPVEPPGEGAPAYEISATELLAIRDWIEQLPQDAGCPDRTRLTPQWIADTIAQRVRTLPPDTARTTRFISLTPVFNDCAPAQEIAAAAQAVTLLINSLSVGLDPVKLQPFDPQGVMLEFDLSLIGWDSERWDRLAYRAPTTPFTVFDAATRNATGTAAPMIAGDWLADAATRAPLYYDLLGLPDSLSGLLATLKLDTAGRIFEGKERLATSSATDAGTVERFGLKTSQVARGNRLLERRSFANGAVWTSSEFAPTAGRPDMFDLIVGAASAAAGAQARATAALPQVQADLSLVHFDLPNGFPAYFAANANGARVNDAPQSILKDDSHPSARFAAAQSCLGCHVSGPVVTLAGRPDDLRARLAAATALPKDLRERLLAMHPDGGMMQRRLDEDNQRFRRAATAAGIDPGLRIGGIDPLTALIERYRRPVSERVLADLVDIEPSALAAMERAGGGPASEVIARSALAPVPRAEVDAVLAEIASRRGLTAIATGIPATPQQIADGHLNAMQLVLKVERPVFHSNDLMLLTAQASQSCYLTVLTLDGRGRATVLYPNEFDANNFVEAGRTLKIPGDNAAYQFRLRDKGRETLIGICATISKTVDGIHHDFEKQRFTELGDYRAFLNRNWSVGGTEAKSARSSRQSKRSSEPSTATGTTGEQGARPDMQARTAIRIMIE